MRFPLRLKFVVFATLMAVVPLAIVGQNLTTLTRDELKSAANEDLMNVAVQLQTESDSGFEGCWLSNLEVIRNAIDSNELGVPQKVSLLTLGLEELPDVVAIQLAIANSNLPILVTDEAFSAKLQAAGLDPVATLTTPSALVGSIAQTGQYGRPVVSQIPETGDWIATPALPLTHQIAGRQVTLAAKIKLSSLGELVRRHPFAERGEITLIDQDGRRVLGDSVEALTDRSIVQSAMPLIVSGARADALQPYARPDGTLMLGAYTLPDWFQWAVVTELSEENAYAVVNAITRQILVTALVGFAIASIGALIFGRQLTKPILAIGAVAEKVGQGNFTVRVADIRSKDEIGDLGGRINAMISHLAERMELMKFVSHGTVSAIQRADKDGILRGGVRKRVSVIFTDIRGYTEFSERVPPEGVIEALNQYFDVQTDIVVKHGGDVDKFVGDALVAVFDGENMEQRAVACCVEIISAMEGLLEKYPDYNLHVGIGAASGEVVMGAMGARERMDFTVLGSTVNLSARLSSKADPGQALVDGATYQAALGMAGVRFDTLDPIPLKGYANPVPCYAAVSVTAPVRATPEAVS